MDAEELAAQAMLSEHEFVSSLIKMYREFQMQAVGFAIVLYTAVLALIGAAIDSQRLVATAANCTALLSYLIALVVLAFAVMEIRVRRASLYIARTLTSSLQELYQQPNGRRVLQWEDAPGAHLTAFERALSHSTLFIALIGIPSLVAAAWHLWGGVIPPKHAHPTIALAGAIALLVACIISAALSIRHETRRAAQRAMNQPLSKLIAGVRRLSNTIKKRPVKRR